MDYRFVSIFNGSYDKKPIASKLLFGQVIEPMRDSTDARLKRYQSALAAGYPYAGALKEQLTAFTPAGVFSRCDDDSCHIPSWLMLLDIDKLQASDLEPLKAAFVASSLGRHIACIFVSPSRHGLKVGFHVSFSTDAVEYKDKYKALLRLVAACIDLSTYSGKLDTKCCNISRLCYISHDPELYTNRQASVLPEELLAPHLVPTIVPSVVPQKSANSGSYSDPEQGFYAVLKGIQRVHKESFTAGNRNNFCFRLGCACSRYGLDVDMVILTAVRELQEKDFHAKEIEKTIRKAYKYTANEYNTLTLKIAQK